MTLSGESDRDRLRSMLDRAGVIYRAVASQAGLDEIIVEAKDSPKNLGYFGFHVVFEFNEAGELQTVGIWE